MKIHDARMVRRATAVEVGGSICNVPSDPVHTFMKILRVVLI